nr:MAG TPA: hypothetical protein [Bacteriophage sp.]
MLRMVTLRAAATSLSLRPFSTRNCFKRSPIKDPQKIG